MARYEISKDGGEFYQYVSPSEVLSLLDKPGLIQWAANMTVNHIQDNIFDMPNGNAMIELFKDARNKHNEKKNETADYGKMFHNILEKWVKAVINGNIDKGNKSSAISYALHFNNEVKQMFYQFWIWQNKVVDKFVRSEMIVVHESMGYAGTLDILAVIGSKLYVLDIKTSKEVYHDTFKQIAAYGQAINDMGTGKYKVKKNQDSAVWYEETVIDKKYKVEGIGIVKVARDFFGTNKKKNKQCIDSFEFKGTEDIDRYTNAWNILLSYFYADKIRRIKNMRDVK